MPSRARASNQTTTVSQKQKSSNSEAMLTTVISILLLCLVSPSTAQVDLSTCGDEDSVVTCSFFGKLDEAFRQADVLYTLRKAFFSSEGNPPPLFVVTMTLDVENVTNIGCKDHNYRFGNSSTDSPPSMEEVCSIYECGPLQLGWRHQWSKTVIS